MPSGSWQSENSQRVVNAQIHHRVQAARSVGRDDAGADFWRFTKSWETLDHVARTHSSFGQERLGEKDIRVSLQPVHNLKIRNVAVLYQLLTIPNITNDLVTFQSCYYRAPDLDSLETFVSCLSRRAPLCAFSHHQLFTSSSEPHTLISILQSYQSVYKTLTPIN